MGGVVSSATDFLGMTDTGATDRAIGAQSGATGASNAELRRQYDESKERFQPYSKTGQDAFFDLYDMPAMQAQYEQFSGADSPMRNRSGVFTMADFTQDPGYQFRMSEGMKAIQRSKGAKGGRNSGSTLKALTEFGQNLASSEYQNAYNRFNQDYANEYNRFGNDQSAKYQMGVDNYNRQLGKLGQIVNYGYGADTTLAGQGQNMAGAISNNLTNMGNAQASAEMHRGDDMRNLTSQGIGFGSMAMLACWVARAVFGLNNPKWKEARYYILNIAPKWFRELYLLHGREFGKRVEKSRVLRVMLRPVFEYFALRARIDNVEIYQGELLCL